jgi:alkanesulfonate monooxygenase SsuD/methylene tetrahydromethanopterin reductase-like flavin-dependent oxidoreductase (luciferase family)
VFWITFYVQANHHSNNTARFAFEQLASGVFMELGLFFMPVHRPEKAWAQTLAEDRDAALLAERCGYAEVWMGEHFSTKVEQVPAPLMFLATLIEQTSRIRFGTGVVNLGHRHPVVVAAEAAQFDQLSGGRLILGVGPGGLMSDGELFGRPEMDERVKAAMESLDMIMALWREEAPVNYAGKYWQASLEKQIWPSHGVGEFCRPLQQPHPPIAMAMVSPGGRTAQTIAERSFIPMSANFVPLDVVRAQWESYSGRRDALNLPADRSIWRVCRNILITDTDEEAQALLDDPDGPFAFYFRYLRGLREMPALAEHPDASIESLNAMLDVANVQAQCVIAGSVSTVTERLVEMTDYLGAFGTLVSVGHDWDETERWQRSIARLAEDVAPVLTQHMKSQSS